MSTSNEVLDAARRCLVRGGGRKVTLAEVAREAGVSRPTVYRRWPEVGAVIRELLTREMAELVAANSVSIDPSSATPDAVLDAMADSIVAVADAVSGDELFVALSEGQPDVIAPYVFTRLGASQRGMISALTGRIEAAQQIGAVRAGVAEHLAAMVLLIAQSAIQSRTMIAPILGSAWSTELRSAIRGYLAPAAGSGQGR
ncbi:TetR/AcrR family transcriptional regulator [Williamsia sp. CHRR-6]|uniref:TetR/AcrR family transcriptional regulator n=1 Tax=Williamsia sp. CHRR-6 TaxID=2835871 RepID=UPI001BDAD9FE|nr:TetR/AcrR family transcriptional regulator [Williamsia sp. CHRR-6]MBT0567765.1 TetR/AcrR family transcriptional regulator [Williamsia sp. CHRR-6]